MEEVGAMIAELVIVVIILGAYTVWSLRFGYRLLSYRSEWLDGYGTVNKIVKFILCFIVGYFVSGFYLGWLGFKFMFKLFMRV